MYSLKFFPLWEEFYRFVPKETEDCPLSRQFRKIRISYFRRGFYLRLFHLTCWRDYFSFKVTCSFWSMAVKIILNHILKLCYVIYVLFKSMRVLACGRR